MREVNLIEAVANVHYDRHMTDLTKRFGMTKLHVVGYDHVEEIKPAARTLEDLKAEREREEKKGFQRMIATSSKGRTILDLSIRL